MDTGCSQPARAAREGGATWLGVATLDEALALRASHDEGRLLCWLGLPGEDYDAAIDLDIDLTAYSVAQLEEIAQRRRAGRTGPPPAEGRHRVVPWGRHARGLAGRVRTSPRR